MKTNHTPLRGPAAPLTQRPQLGELAFACGQALLPYALAALLLALGAEFPW